MDLKSNFSREWTAGVLFRMQRGFQPTIRLSSLIVGIRQVTVCRAGVSSLPWHLCPPRLHLGVEPQGTVRWRHAPLLGPLRQCRSKRKSLSPAASRRPPVGRRGHRKTAGFVDAIETAPLGPRRQPLNSRLPKNVIFRRLRLGKSSASVDQSGRHLWHLFPQRMRRLFPQRLARLFPQRLERLFPQRFVRSVFGLCSFRLPARAKDG